MVIKLLLAIVRYIHLCIVPAGRPKKTPWQNCVSEDLRLLGLNIRDAQDGQVKFDGSLTQHCLETQALNVDDDDAYNFEEYSQTFPIIDRPIALCYLWEN